MMPPQRCPRPEIHGEHEWYWRNTFRRDCDGQVALTPRELDVLRQVAQGRADKQIAAVLGISEANVQGRVRDLRTKLGAVNRAHAVTRGFHLGLLTLEPA